MIDIVIAVVRKQKEPLGSLRAQGLPFSCHILPAEGASFGNAAGGARRHSARAYWTYFPTSRRGMHWRTYDRSRRSAMAPESSAW
jgi:hypothetical protein